MASDLRNNPGSKGKNNQDNSDVFPEAVTRFGDLTATQFLTLDEIGHTLCCRLARLLSMRPHSLSEWGIRGYSLFEWGIRSPVYIYDGQPTS